MRASNGKTIRLSMPHEHQFRLKQLVGVGRVEISAKPIWTRGRAITCLIAKVATAPPESDEFICISVTCRDAASISRAIRS